jgi:AraC-like DNA-binding protein
VSNENWKPQNVLLGTSGSAPIIKSGDKKPEGRLAPYVSSLWWMSWEIPSEVQIPFLVIPTGCMSVVFDKGQQPRGLGAMVVGVRTIAHNMTLEGTGYMVGLIFHPGGSWPLLKTDATSLTNNVAPLSKYTTSATGPLERMVMETNFDEQCQMLQNFFSPLFPLKVDPNIILIQEVYAFIASLDYNPQMEEISNHFHLSERKLQRLFKQYVGVTPKALIITKRFQWAAKLILQGQDLNWADFAAELGYTDQAHFIKDFKKITGHTPERAKNLRG